jgi:hypothetical protein
VGRSIRPDHGERGASGQKASAGLALLWEASTGFRRMRRAERGPAGRPYNGMTQSLAKEGFARPVHEMEAASRGRVSST